MNKVLNLFKTGILFTILTGLLLSLGYAIGGKGALLPFFLISLVVNIGSYWFSDKIALRMSHSKPLLQNDSPAIHNMTKELSEKMGIPTPRLFVSEDAQPNAFATGRNPSNGVVSVTRGLMNLLNENEIRGVIAHELAHIRNRDILTGTIAAVMAGSISYLGQVGIFGGDGENRNPLGLVLIILAPIAALLIQLAISRSREFEADRGAAEATKEPMALAGALQKIQGYTKQLPLHTNPAMSSLYIQNPFSAKGIAGWFSTHPATEKRVEKLREYKF